jgi:hypothetical protein
MINAGLAELHELGLIPVDECGRSIWPESIMQAWVAKIYQAMNRVPKGDPSPSPETSVVDAEERQNQTTSFVDQG